MLKDLCRCIIEKKETQNETPQNKTKLKKKQPSFLFKSILKIKKEKKSKNKKNVLSLDHGLEEIK